VEDGIQIGERNRRTFRNHQQVRHELPVFLFDYQRGTGLRGELALQVDDDVGALETEGIFNRIGSKCNRDAAVIGPRVCGDLLPGQFVLDDDETFDVAGV
jgi:hypothetical protein